MAVETNDLVAEVTDIPVNPGAAMRLLWMLEDPATSAQDLGRLIETDPALSTQVIRHANTAFYGLTGQVASAARAVNVVGLSTVRALATTAAFDLFSDRGRGVPEGFWKHSVRTAAAASVLAKRVGIDASEAFSAGLLHDIGMALVFRRAPRRYEDVLSRVDPTSGRDLVRAEQEEFGFSHAQVGAAALGVMKFPAELVGAIARHHDRAMPPGVGMPSLLRAADALALEADRGASLESNTPVCDALEALGLLPDAGPDLVAEVRADEEDLAGILSPRG
ncbi:MAG: HDOD domain-containing protein [Acidimicrobiia bacterium]|nr:HDOD domain-containing protein [Acidimicrobiia bacterium]